MRTFPKTLDEVTACMDALVANPVPMNTEWLKVHVNTGYQLKVTLAYLFGSHYNHAFRLLEADHRDFSVATPKLYPIEPERFLESCRDELIELLDYTPYDSLYVTLAAAFELTLYDAARELADIAMLQTGLRNTWHTETVAPIIYAVDSRNGKARDETTRRAAAKAWLLEGKRL